MITEIYKKLVIDFPKFTLALIFILLSFSVFHAKNFNLDASSDALLLEGDPDLKYLREVNETYGSKDFLILTYAPVASFAEKETILKAQEESAVQLPSMDEMANMDWSDIHKMVGGI